MDAWDTLKANSSLPGGDAWDNLLSQNSGTGGSTIIVDGIYTADVNYSATSCYAVNFLSADIQDSFQELEIVDLKNTSYFVNIIEATI